jgi:hypothetical protein
MRQLVQETPRHLCRGSRLGLTDRSLSSCISCRATNLTDRLDVSREWLDHEEGGTRCWASNTPDSGCSSP